MMDSFSHLVAAPFVRLGRGPTLFLGFIALNMLSCAALIDQMLVLHARALGIGTGWVGVLNALLPFAMMVSIFMTATAQRLGSKRLLISGWTMRNIMITPIVLTPLAYKWWGTHGAAIVLFLGVAMFCLVRAITGIGWSSWLHEIVAEENRGFYFTIESVVARGMGILFGVAVFLFFSGQPALWKFSVMSAFGVSAGLASIWFLARVPGGGPVPDTSAQPRSSRDEYRRVLGDHYFRPFLVLMLAGTFVGTAQPLVFTLFMRDHLGFPPGPIMLIGAIASAVAMCTVHRWTRIADSHGSPVTMAAAGFLIVAAMGMLGLAGHDRLGVWFIGLLAIVLAVGSSGFFVTAARSFMHRIDASMRHAYVAVWSTATALFAGTASILAGVLVRGGSHQAFTLTALGLALLMAAACVALLRLPERGVDFEAHDYELFDPGQPVLSILRMYGYVLKPMAASAHMLKTAK